MAVVVVVAVVALVAVVTVVAVVAGAKGGTHHGRHLQTGRNHICISQLCTFTLRHGKMRGVKDSPPSTSPPSGGVRAGGSLTPRILPRL